jgi:GGDEF domain-containing protein
MLQRLHEEVARAKRHGDTLSVVLGETLSDARTPPEVSAQLTAWTALQIANAKRLGDVAGQYGLGCFMLLLPQTSNEGALHCCRRIRSLLERPTKASPAPVRVVFGVASLCADICGGQALLCRAEERLELAKLGLAGIVGS